MHNGRPHVQKHELDPPVSQLEIGRISTTSPGSLLPGEDARFGAQHNPARAEPNHPSGRSRSRLTVAYDVAPKAEMTQEETLATSIF